MSKPRKRKSYNHNQDKHILTWAQIIGTTATSALLGKYYWELIKKVNPQIENDWNWKKQQLKEKLKKPFMRD